MKTRPTSAVASISSSLALWISVTKKIRPASRSGLASTGRARSPPTNCVVSMHTPTFSMMSQTRAMLSFWLMSDGPIGPLSHDKPDGADPFLISSDDCSVRHCERSEAIHVTACGTMDCFVASRLAMTWMPRSSLRFAGRGARDTQAVPSYNGGMRKRERKQISSPLPQALLLIAQHRRQEVFDHAARSGLDLDRDGHARRQIDHSPVYVDPGRLHRDLGRIDEFLALRFAAVAQRRL